MHIYNIYFHIISLAQYALFILCLGLDCLHRAFTVSLDGLAPHNFSMSLPLSFFITILLFCLPALPIYSCFPLLRLSILVL